MHSHVLAEQQRHLTVNQADVIVLRGCESYHMHQSLGKSKEVRAKRWVRVLPHAPEVLGAEAKWQTIRFQTRLSRFKSERPSQRAKRQEQRGKRKEGAKYF